MKLYYSPLSSNSRKVRIVAALLDIPLELLNVENEAAALMLGVKRNQAQHRCAPLNDRTRKCGLVSATGMFLPNNIRRASLQ